MVGREREKTGFDQIALKCDQRLAYIARGHSKDMPITVALAAKMATENRRRIVLGVRGTIVPVAPTPG